MRVDVAADGAEFALEAARAVEDAVGHGLVRPIGLRRAVWRRGATAGKRGFDAWQTWTERELRRAAEAANKVGFGGMVARRDCARGSRMDSLEVNKVVA